MSSVKIQVFTGGNYRTEVFVDNKFVYQTGTHPNIEMEHLNKLISALEVENIEVTNKERV